MNRLLSGSLFQSNLLASGANDSEIYIWDLNNFNNPMTPGAKSQVIYARTLVKRPVCFFWQNTHHITQLVVKGKVSTVVRISNLYFVL